MEVIRKNSLKDPAKQSNAPCLTIVGVILEAALTEIFLNLSPPQTLFFFKQKTAYEITRTGVQTCALPICVHRPGCARIGAHDRREGPSTFAHQVPIPMAMRLMVTEMHSPRELRLVGELDMSTTGE